ncbi:hypothetical protein [Nostoc sp. DSM 114167]|uniref:hypothetical protein n=1 Tax=Nostoc sp. DSM 114167 TaxID=3439050 RepID=UPI00404533EC
MSLDRIILFKNPPPDASKKSARPTIMLSGVFVNIVQSMTFAIAYSGWVRHRATIRHNKLN